MLRLFTIVCIIAFNSNLFGSDLITKFEDIQIETESNQSFEQLIALTGTGTIGGYIETYFGDPLINVTVTLKSDQPGYPTTDKTDKYGEYEFDGLELGFNYKICPAKVGDELNGVNFYDVFLMYKLIKYSKYYDLPPYFYIAADVNGDQEVDGNDLVSLLKVIFRRRSSFPNNNSWAFVDANFDFIDESNPWPYANDISINNLEDESWGNDFIAIKIGDLSGSAKTNKSNNVMTLTSVDQYVETNAEVTVQFNVNATTDVQGMQLFLDQADVDVLSIDSELFNAEASYTYDSDNTFKTMWYEANSDKKKDNVVNITIMPKKNGMLSELLRLDNSDHQSEIYTGSEENMTAQQIAFDFNASSLVSDFVVSQNFPNPFIDQTSIDFDLKNAAQLGFQIIDTNGSVVYSSTIKGKKGKNSINVSSDDLGTSGVFRYQLTLDDEVVTKTMIITK